MLIQDNGEYCRVSTRVEGIYSQKRRESGPPVLSKDGVSGCFPVARRLRGDKRVAVVTGANRGIGLEICRQLGKRGDIHIVLTSRDDAKGRSVAKKLADDGVDVEFRSLDVTKERNVKALADFVGSAHGHCDILVNNAVFSPIRAARASSIRKWKVSGDARRQPVRRAQWRGARAFMQRNATARVNVSSGLGQLSDMGVGSPAYRISKAALNALTGILAAELKGSGVLVNSMTPGWVRTDMGGPGAPRTVEEGADTAVWLATLPDNGPTGGFFRDRKPIPW